MSFCCDGKGLLTNEVALLRVNFFIFYDFEHFIPWVILYLWFVCHCFWNSFRLMLSFICFQCYMLFHCNIHTTIYFSILLFLDFFFVYDKTVLLWTFIYLYTDLSYFSSFGLPVKSKFNNKNHQNLFLIPHLISK